MSSPCASGEKAMTPMPSAAVVSSSDRPAAASSPRSIQRLSIEYEGWWMSSGVPRPRMISCARTVSSALYDEMPTYRARPEVTAVCSAPIVSSSGVSGSGR